ncbi:MAG: hypothetical protein KAG61_07600 [Bacteriovoracaceae bacterium]|nr:hypothetical protein [Bacteriovoracaceae bacterium]
MKFIFIALIVLSSATFASTDFTGQLPSSWVQLPEDGGVQSGSIMKGGQSLGAAAEAVDTIFSSNHDVLKKVKTVEKNGWSLTGFQTGLYISESGLVGLATMKGVQGIRLHWKRYDVPEVKETVSNNTIPLTSKMTSNEILAEIGPAIQIALKSKKIKVKDERLVRAGITNAASKYQKMIQGIESAPTSQWFVNKLRFDISISASGVVVPGASAGAAMRFRFEWSRKESDLVRTRINYKTPTSKFVAAMLEDVEFFELHSKGNPKFKLTSFLTGISLTASGNIALVKSKVGVAGYIYFARRKARVASVPAKSTKYSYSLLAKSTPQLESYANRSNIEFAKNSNGTTLFHLDRDNFRRGLLKAGEISRFFVDRAERSQGKVWGINIVENQFNLSVSGTVGVAGISGSSVFSMLYKRVE